MNQLSKFRREEGMLPSFSNIFDEVFNNDFFNKMDLGTHIPAANVREGLKHYAIDLAAPGHTKADFNIEVSTEGIITISAKSEKNIVNDDEKINRKEYSLSSFSRSFHLPDNAEHSKISAAYENGILTIHVPKLEKNEPDTSKHRIQVN